MREVLTILACLIIGVALRSCRTLSLRKLGALTFLIASFLILFFLFDSIFAGLIGVTLWFLLPWFDLLTRIRHMKLPLKNRLKSNKAPSEEHFPNASRLISEIEAAEFDHVEDSGWDWVGMRQYFRFFWHPEAKAVAAVCLCEHENIAFAFVTVSSTSADGRTIHTTNYPFSPTLKHTPSAHWDHLPCEKNQFRAVFRDHIEHLKRLTLKECDLMTPDPEAIITKVENEMEQQIAHNLECGLIELTGDGHFRYSMKGIFFLWIQAVKDMIRLC